MNQFQLQFEFTSGRNNLLLSQEQYTMSLSLLLEAAIIQFNEINKHANFDNTSFG